MPSCCLPCRYFYPGVCDWHSAERLSLTPLATNTHALICGLDDPSFHAGDSITRLPCDSICVQAKPDANDTSTVEPACGSTLGGVGQDETSPPAISTAPPSFVSECWRQPPAANGLSPTITLLPQDPYQEHCTRRTTTLSGPIEFGHMSLLDATQTRLDDYPDRGRPAFSPDIQIGQKMSVRLQFDGHRPYTRQINVGRIKRTRRSLTRGELATLVAKEIVRFIDKEKQYGTPLRLLEREVSSADLVLVKVRHVSRGSIQPEIGLLRRHA
ncbi:hypothetical protein C8Q76DRAFT_723479 [Earliella scabrosa]|nr:hypothetical protein C8Q76DRAFT_723479 [Earliella scabrosa]